MHALSTRAHAHAAAGACCGISMQFTHIYQHTNTDGAAGASAAHMLAHNSAGGYGSDSRGARVWEDCSGGAAAAAV